MSFNTNPADNYFALTPSDTANTAFRALYIGGAGNVVVVSFDGDAVTFAGATAGSILPISGIRVNATFTTATSIVALV